MSHTTQLVFKHSCGLAASHTEYIMFVCADFRVNLCFHSHCVNMCVLKPNTIYMERERETVFISECEFLQFPKMKIRQTVD